MSDIYYETKLGKLYKGDCLIENENIENGSVDLIITDLPYGNMKNAPSTWDKSKTEWDITIDPKKVYEIANRILRKNGKMILFSQEPYTTKLISESIANIQFGYRAIWEKDNFANALCCNKNMVSFTEDILIFSKKLCYTGKNPLKKIMETYVLKYGKDYLIDLVFKEGRYKTIDSTKASTSYKFGFNEGRRFELMDLKMYNYLSEFINFKETYIELKEIDNQFKNKFASTFNLWEGKKYKSNILKYKKDYNGYHPTAKPVLLIEDLIKTFSNEGDLIVDLTSGSGTTAVACENTNRKWICIEKDEDNDGNSLGYCDITVKRLKGELK